jgi:hypothetical protein
MLPTANMCDAARLMYRHGVPFDQKAIVNTDLSQRTYTEHPDLAARRFGPSARCNWSG